MPVKLTNIIKGVNKKLLKKARSKNYPPISWMQEKVLKHQDEKDIKTIRLGNLHIQYRYPFEILHTYRELFEEEIYRFKTASQSPLIIDCGANIGMSVLYFKSLYPKSAIIAYEPDENNCSLLSSNIELNNLDTVIVKKEAVWINDETLSFNSIGAQGSQIAADETKASSNKVKVKAIRLAKLLEENEVDFLKIDIEGAEYEVMKDCANSLSSVRNLFVEYHGKVSETEKLVTILNILNDNKFDVYMKMAADHLQHPFVSKETGLGMDVQLNIFGYRR